MQEFESNPHLFGFVAALRKLECIYDDKPRLGESARSRDDGVRLQQDPSLAFAPRPLANFKAGAQSTPAQLATYFFGLFGPNGPMPHHLSEYAYSRELNDSDRTFRAFADMFHHRLASLFFRASVDGDPAISMDRPGQNRFDLYVGAVLGIGPDAFHDRDAMPDFAKRYHAAILAMQTRPAAAFADLLQSYFRLPFEIEELIGEWLTLAPEDCSRLGIAACRLGDNVILGREIWSCQHRFRIVCGPLSLHNFERLLPGLEEVSTLFAIVRNYVGDEFAWDVQLVLKKEDVPGIRLGQAGQLGWTTWLGTRKRDQDADDVIIDLQRTAAFRTPGDQSLAA